MKNIARDSIPSHRDNEDFCFAAPLSSSNLLVVGDFAQSTYVPIDATATHELEQLLKDPSIIAAGQTSIALLLIQLAAKFNGRLLTFKETSQSRFQCSVVFAAISGATLYFLPIGDCRIAVRRGSSLILLNGSVWEDPSGQALTYFVAASQENRRGQEPPPDQALGNSPVTFSPSDVTTFPLERDDLVLLYSDGVDKFVSPTRVLELIEGHRRDDPLQNLVTVILEEARLEHSDDDRTLLVSQGPYLGIEDAAIARAQQEFDSSVEGMKKKIAALATEIATANSLETLLLNLKETVDTVAAKVKDLPNREEFTPKPSKTSAANVEKIVTAIGQLGSEIQGLKKLIATQGNQTRKERPEARVAAIADNLPANKTESELKLDTPQITQPEILDLNLYRPFREGVIHVTEGIYELVDDNYVNTQEQSISGRYLVQNPTVRPGLLTACYLYMRTLPEQKPVESSADSMRHWVQTNLGRCLEKVGQLPEHQLLELRRKHWELRDRREKFHLSPTQRARLTADELHVASTVFRNVPEANGKIVTQGPLHSKFDKQKMLSYLNDPLKVILIVLLTAIGIVAVVSAIYYFRGDSPGTRTAPVPSRQTEAVKLDYGADGRTLLAAFKSGGSPMPLDYRIRVGRESDFKRAYSGVIFDSVDQLKTVLSGTAASMVEGPNDEITVPDDQYAFQKIDTADLQGPINEKCSRFVSRINAKLTGNVPNTVQDIERLNPGLRCSELDVGDLILVVAKPKPRRQR